MKVFNIVLALFLSLTVFQAFAQTGKYQEGTAYQLIIPEQPTATANKIEIVELFWYGCPHCHRFEPYIERWLETKPANVEFIRMPAILRDNWEVHARAYYTAEVLGVLDKMHSAIFQAIHGNKRKLDTEDELRNFFVEQGVSKENFDKTFRSFAVDAKVRRAKEMSSRYGVNGTPALIIDGKYRTDGTLVPGGFNELLSVADYLVQKEAAAKR